MRGLGDWYLYEIAFCLHAGNLPRHAFKDKSIKVSLTAVNNIIVVTYYSKCHRLSLSLITGYVRGRG